MEPNSQSQKNLSKVNKKSAIGVLKITVLEASGQMISGGSGQVYCVLSLRDNKFKTALKRSALIRRRVVQNESFEFSIEDMSDQIFVTCWKSDRYIGQTSIKLLHLGVNESSEKWYQLVGHDKNSINAVIRLRSSYTINNVLFQNKQSSLRHIQQQQQQNRYSGNFTVLNQPEIQKSPSNFRTQNQSLSRETSCSSLSDEDNLLARSLTATPSINTEKSSITHTPSLEGRLSENSPNKNDLNISEALRRIKSPSVSSLIVPDSPITQSNLKIDEIRNVSLTQSQIAPVSKSVSQAVSKPRFIDYFFGSKLEEIDESKQENENNENSKSHSSNKYYLQNDGRTKPKLFYRYPETDRCDLALQLDNLFMFSFPSHLTYSSTQQTPISYHFALTVSEERVYGTTLIYQQEILKEKESKTNLYEPCSLVILSRQPYLQQFSQILKYIYYVFLSSPNIALKEAVDSEGRLFECQIHYLCCEIPLPSQAYDIQFILGRQFLDDELKKLTEREIQQINEFSYPKFVQKENVGEHVEQTKKPETKFEQKKLMQNRVKDLINQELRNSDIKKNLIDFDSENLEDKPLDIVTRNRTQSHPLMPISPHRSSTSKTKNQRVKSKSIHTTTQHTHSAYPHEFKNNESFIYSSTRLRRKSNHNNRRNSVLHSRSRKPPNIIKTVLNDDSSRDNLFYRRSNSRDSFCSDKSIHDLVTLPSNAQNICIEPVFMRLSSEFSDKFFRFTPLNLNLYENLFSVLDLSTILQIFCCVLCEMSIVFYSSQYSLLTKLQECLHALIFPFRWAHVQIPLLPEAIHHVIEAPVPFMVGIYRPIEQEDKNESDNDNSGLLFNKESIIGKAESLKKAKMPVNRRQMSYAVVGEGVVKVDIDSSTIDYNKRLPSFSYNMTKEFLFEVRRLIKPSAFASDQVLKETFDTESTKLQMDLRRAFLRFIGRLLGDYRGFLYFANGQTPIFNTSSFLQQNSQNAPFMSRFLQTHMFSSFLHRHIQDPALLQDYLVYIGDQSTSDVYDSEISSKPVLTIKMPDCRLAQSVDMKFLDKTKKCNGRHRLREFYIPNSLTEQNSLSEIKNSNSLQTQTEADTQASKLALITDTKFQNENFSANEETTLHIQNALNEKSQIELDKISKNCRISICITTIFQSESEISIGELTSMADLLKIRKQREFLIDQVCYQLQYPSIFSEGNLRSDQDDNCIVRDLKFSQKIGRPKSTSWQMRSSYETGLPIQCFEDLTFFLHITLDECLQSGTDRDFIVAKQILDISALVFRDRDTLDSNDSSFDLNRPTSASINPRKPPRPTMRSLSMSRYNKPEFILDILIKHPLFKKQKFQKVVFTLEIDQKFPNTVRKEVSENENKSSLLIEQREFDSEQCFQHIIRYSHQIVDLELFDLSITCECVLDQCKTCKLSKEDTDMLKKTVENLYRSKHAHLVDDGEPMSAGVLLSRNNKQKNNKQRFESSTINGSSDYLKTIHSTVSAVSSRHYSSNDTKEDNKSDSLTRLMKHKSPPAAVSLNYKGNKAGKKEKNFIEIRRQQSKNNLPALKIKVGKRDMLDKA